MTTVPALSDEAALNQYTATSGQTDFNFTYMIFATADIKVYVNGVLKTETTHYTVKKSSGASIADSDLPLDGGKVVFVSGLTLNDEVTLSREIAIARLTGYSPAGAFRAETLNAELTKMYAVMQQLRRDIERSLRLTAYDAEGGTFVLPANRASKYLAFDADGNMIASAGTTEVPVSSFMETLLDDVSAAAARTTLGLALGSDVQAWDAQLDTLAALASVANLSALAGLTGAANKIPRFTGAGTLELIDLVASSEAASGIIEIATQAEVTTGTDDVRAITPLKLKNATGKILQMVHTASSTQAATSASFPQDDTIPQNTEGAAYSPLDTAFTPQRADSTLLIQVVLNFSENRSAFMSGAAALFVDSTADALAAQFSGTNADCGTAIVINYAVSSASTTLRTYKVRYGTMGIDGAAINGTVGSALFGGAMKSTMTIMEII